MNYESYILLDTKLVVTLEAVALWVRTLRRKVWGQDAFLKKLSAVQSEGLADTSPSKSS